MNVIKNVIGLILGILLYPIGMLIRTFFIVINHGYFITAYDREFVAYKPDGITLIEVCGRCGAVWDDKKNQARHSVWCRIRRLFSDNEIIVHREVKDKSKSATTPTPVDAT
jgi:hypothetical protein